ncbi:putative UDP-3-O-(3-hydroxymyristoyl)glucosamine N-acyltransferase [Dioscorea sansibarensis]
MMLRSSWRVFGALEAYALLAKSVFRVEHPPSFVPHRLVSLTSSSDDPKDGNTTGMPEFKKWHNGGGLFHSTACVDPSALIEAGAIIHENSVLAMDVYIGSGAVVGPSVSIGQSTKIGYNVVLSNCSIGASCVVHNGVCIGQDGFGFFIDGKGCVQKKPQLLHVRIGDHVEIGANTCIDRGSWRDTVVGEHTKIDNLVQIGHNVVIGKCCMLCGQVGIAGSATIGDYVTLGGRVAVRDHVSIASKVRLAANSSVTKDIEESGDYGGFPAVPIHEWRRQAVKMRTLLKDGVSKG